MKKEFLTNGFIALSRASDVSRWHRPLQLFTDRWSIALSGGARVCLAGTVRSSAMSSAMGVPHPASDYVDSGTPSFDARLFPKGEG